eukprot:m.87376 g.87376  ORF g.87376 m.87376 type:complete len:170 (+) comp16401_c0_seq1:375-884(+)
MKFRCIKGVYLLVLQVRGVLFSHCYDGIWKLGLHGKNVSYSARFASTWPPILGGDAGWNCDLGHGPPPLARRSHLPPVPPPPPPPPPPSPLPPPPPLPPARLILNESFSGSTLNTSVWNVLEQVHRGGVYTADNVAVRDGVLVLRTVARNQTIDGKDFFVASGAVNTSG